MSVTGRGRPRSAWRSFAGLIAALLVLGVITAPLVADETARVALMFGVLVVLALARAWRPTPSSAAGAVATPASMGDAWAPTRVDACHVKRR